MKQIMYLLLLTLCAVSCNRGAYASGTALVDDEFTITPEDSVYLKAADPEVLMTMSPAQVMRMVAAYKLFEHVELKDSVYTLLISESEAKEIGVPTDIYREMEQSLKSLNRGIAEINGQHGEIDLLDVKDYVLKGVVQK